MREVAVKCLGLYSCLDIKDAETNLPLLYQFALTDLTPIRLVALKCGADVLTIFPGLLANGNSVALDLLSSLISAVDANYCGTAAVGGEQQENVTQNADGKDSEENEGSEGEEEDVLLGYEEEDIGEEMEIRNVAIKALAKFLLLGRLKKQPAMQKQVGDMSFLDAGALTTFIALCIVVVVVVVVRASSLSHRHSVVTGSSSPARVVA